VSFQLKSSGSDEEVYQPLAEINMTPFIDVMLVLLIIFMVTAPMLATGMNVDLPKAGSAQTLENQEPVVVSVSADGKVFVGTDETPPSEVAPAVARKLAGTHRPVHIRGDQGTSYGTVVSVMDDLAAAGITKIAIVTRTRSFEPTQSQ